MRRRRTALGLTQAQVAELSGLTLRTVQKAEKGQAIAKDSACRLSAALGTPYAEILRPTAEQVHSALMEAGFAPPPPPLPWAERAAESDLLCAALRGVEPVTCCISGASGIGKTALAQHIVATVSGSFPTGVVWIRAPAEARLAAAVQVEVAQALGFRERLPSPDLVGAEALYGAFQARMRKHRRLLVLDDVESPEVLAAFVGRAPGWTLVTTARRGVAERVDGPTTILGPLDEEAAFRLLAGHLDDSRVQADSEGVRRVVVQLGRVPRSLQIAGRVLRDERYTRPSDYATRLAHSMAEGDTAQVGPWSDLEDPDASFASSHGQLRQRLSPQAWDALGALSVLDGEPFPLGWAAAVLGVDEQSAGRLLGELTDYHLLGEARGWLQLDAQAQRVASWVAGDRAREATKRLLWHAGQRAEAIGALPADEMLPAFDRHAALWRGCLQRAAFEVVDAFPDDPPASPSGLPACARERLPEARLLPRILWGLRALFRLTTYPEGWKWLAAGLTIARETGDHLGYAHVAELYAWWRAQVFDAEGAARWCGVAEDAYARAGHRDDMARMALTIAQFTWGSGAARLALSEYERALSLSRGPGVEPARLATALVGSALSRLALHESPAEIIARLEEAAALCAADDSPGARLVWATATLDAAVIRHLFGEVFDSAMATEAWRVTRSLRPQDEMGDFIVDTVAALLGLAGVPATDDAPRRRRVLLGSAPELALRTVVLLGLVLLAAERAPAGMSDDWAGGIDVGGVPLGAHDVPVCLPLQVEIGHAVALVNPLEPLRALLDDEGVLLALRWLDEVVGADHPLTAAYRQLAASRGLGPPSE